MYTYEVNEVGVLNPDPRYLNQRIFRLEVFAENDTQQPVSEIQLVIEAVDYESVVPFFEGLKTQKPLFVHQLPKSLSELDI